MLLRVPQWCELLDVAGWCVALRKFDGTVIIWPRARAALDCRGGGTATWPELIDTLIHLDPPTRPVKGQSLQIWALPSAPTSLKCGDPRDITNREREILHWLREGKSTPEISIIIGCAVRTAEKHIANLYQKLGVKNRAMAILRINGGLEPPMSPAEDTPTLLDHNDLDPGHVRDGRRMSHFIKERLDCGEDASFEKLDPLLLTELLKGRPVSMIANSLGIRSDSVQRRLRAVRDELGVDNNRQLCSMLNLLKV